MTSTERTFVNELRRAIELKDECKLQSEVLSASTMCYEDSAQVKYEDDFFYFLCEVVFSQASLQSSFSHRMVAFLQQNWGKITESQKYHLCVLFEKYYEGFEDWMSQFLISEMLGYNLSNQGAVEILSKFVRSKSENVRAMVAYGLRCALKSTEHKVQEKAKKLLLDLYLDPSEVVRKEVRLAGILYKNDDTSQSVR